MRNYRRVPYALVEHPEDPATSDIVYGDAAYGSRVNVAACASAGVVPGILHKINVTARG